MDKFMNIIVIIYCVTTANSLYTGEPNRILDGLNATENEFPFMVSLQRLSEIHSNTRGHRCGGVLVTLQHALTAAECTLDFDSGQWIPINRDEYRVFAGSVLLTNDTSADRVRRIANTTAHPEYNATTNLYVNNIAVIILGTPFSVNTVTRLPTPIRDIGTINTVRCTIIGWGSGTHLLYGPVQALSDSECIRFMGASLPNTLCGWYEYHGIGISSPPHAACLGDEGGPLVCQDELVGIIVDNRGCTSIPSFPPFWNIRVSRYITWIDSVVALPIPDLGPEPSTVPPPTTLPPTTLPPVTPGAASTFQPGMAVLAVLAVAQIIVGNVIN